MTDRAAEPLSESIARIKSRCEEILETEELVVRWRKECSKILACAKELEAGRG